MPGDSMKLNSIVGVFLWCLLCSVSAGSADALKEGFMNPPDSARPHTWWHWVNGNVSQKGITKDLEAMKAVGIGGFVLFDGSVLIPPGPVGFNTEKEHDLRSFALAEANRLGLEAGFNNSSGWSSTGGSLGNSGTLHEDAGLERNPTERGSFRADQVGRRETRRGKRAPDDRCGFLPGCRGAGLSYARE